MANKRGRPKKWADAGEWLDRADESQKRRDMAKRLRAVEDGAVARPRYGKRNGGGGLDRDNGPVSPPPGVVMREEAKRKAEERRRVRAEMERQLAEVDEQSEARLKARLSQGNSIDAPIDATTNLTDASAGVTADTDEVSAAEVNADDANADDANVDDVNADDVNTTDEAGDSHDAFATEAGPLELAMRSDCPNAVGLRKAVQETQLGVRSEIRKKYNGVPPKMVKGAPNPDYFRFTSAFLSTLALRGLAGDETATSGRLKDLERFFAAEAESCGFDPRQLADVRTDEEKALAFADRLLTMPTSILELSEGEIDAIERAMDRADSVSREYVMSIVKEEERLAEIGARRMRGGGGEREPMALRANRLKEKEALRQAEIERGGAETEEERLKREEEERYEDDLERVREKRGTMEARGAVLKKWRGLLAKVRRLQTRARVAIPMTDGIRREAALRMMNLNWVESWLEAAHPLRFMVYVGRSNISGGGESKKRAGSQVFKIGKHHGKMAVDYWIARRWVRVGTPETVVRTGWSGEVGFFKEECPYDGCVILCPLRHGKTELFLHVMALELSLNTQLQTQFLHAKEDEAAKNLNYVRRCFVAEEECGRRRNALYPGIEMDKRDNDSTHFRIKNRNAPKQPNITASGVMANMLGSNLDLLYCDDVVPQKDAIQPTDRENRFDILRGTWASRLQGDRSFRLMVGTLWHHEDATMKYVMMGSEFSKTGGKRGMALLVSKQACGGPKENFKALWAEMYPSGYLRKRFEELGAALYAASHQLDPLPDQNRIVKKLRYFNPNTKEHADFLDGCTRRFSIDPSATRNRKSDKAGVVYFGHGSLVTRTVDANGTIDVTSERRLRLLDADQLSANQVDVVQYALVYAEGHPVDFFHIESRSGFNAVGDIMENYHGLPPSAIVRYDPKSKDKGERFRSVSSLMDDSASAMGLRAVFELPCECDADLNPVLDSDGNMKVAETYRWVENQILNFGATGQDHVLDAITQVLIDLMHDLKPGLGGFVTQSMSSGAVRKGDHRVAAMLDRIMRPESDRTTAASVDADWMLRNW